MRVRNTGKCKHIKYFDKKFIQTFKGYNNYLEDVWTVEILNKKLSMFVDSCRPINSTIKLICQQMAIKFNVPNAVIGSTLTY